MNILEIVEKGLDFKIEDNDIKQLIVKIKEDDINELNKYSTELIKGKFKSTIKDTAFEFDDLKNSNLEKGFHSLVLYSLGMVLKKLFKNAFDTFMEKHIKDDKKVKDILPFDWIEYIWRLASFYHDVMTKYEKTNHKFPCVFNPFLTIENYLKYYCNYNVQYTIFGDYWNLKQIIKKYSRNNHIYKPKNTYNEEIVNRYFRKRLGKDRLDHGILSGYVFYNQLINNYLNQIGQKHKKDYKDGSFDTENSDKITIKYRPVHLLLFKYIADAIIAHNIWHYKSEEKYEYIFWGLESLSSNKRLSFKKNPLAFMLGLLDAMEPVKFFCKDDNIITPKDVLEGINIEWSDNNEYPFLIKISQCNNKNLKVLNYDKWYKEKFENMDWWLDLTVEPKRGTNKKITEIVITIPS